MPITFETLTNNRCLVDTFDRNFQYNVEHVSLAKQADVVLIAPATANVIAKMAHGLADDMLTTTVLSCACKKIVAPAMNVNMYQNPILQENIEKLKKLGYLFVEPGEGLLACGDDSLTCIDESLLDVKALLDTVCELIRNDLEKVEIRTELLDNAFDGKH